MICPICKRETLSLYRNTPKGKRAKFVCLDCVPDELKPDEETKRIAEMLSDGSETDDNL